MSSGGNGLVEEESERGFTLCSDQAVTDCKRNQSANHKVMHMSCDRVLLNRH